MQPTGIHPTVMSLGSEGGNNLLNPPKFNPSSDKLAWRKSVRYWASNVKACADGGDGRAKGAPCALALTLFRSLPISKQQTLEKLVDSGELSIDGSNDVKEQTNAVEKIISVVAKDSTTESIQRLARLSRDAMGCQRRQNESIADYVERFSVPALAYLNLTSAGKSSAESQNLAVALITNAKLPSITQTAVMAALVHAAKERKGDGITTVALERTRLEMAKKCLNALVTEPATASEEVRKQAKETVVVVDKALEMATKKTTEAGAHLSLIHI